MKTLALFALLALTACASVPTQTFNEKLLVGYAAVTSVLQSDATLYSSGVLSKADAKNVEDRTDNIKQALDIAQATYTTDKVTGGNKLADALTALTSLQAYLNTAGKQ
jgi:hypothetical protein